MLQGFPLVAASGGYCLGCGAWASFNSGAALLRGTGSEGTGPRVVALRAQRLGGMRDLSQTRDRAVALTSKVDSPTTEPTGLLFILSNYLFI